MMMMTVTIDFKASGSWVRGKISCEKIRTEEITALHLHKDINIDFIKSVLNCWLYNKSLHFDWFLMLCNERDRLVRDFTVPHFDVICDQLLSRRTAT